MNTFQDDNVAQSQPVGSSRPIRLGWGGFGREACSLGILRGLDGFGYELKGDDSQMSPSQEGTSPSCFKLYLHFVHFLNAFPAYFFLLVTFHPLAYYIFALFI